MTSLLIARSSCLVMVSLTDAAVRSVVLACLAATTLAAFRVRQVTVHLEVWTGSSMLPWRCRFSCGWRRQFPFESQDHKSRQSPRFQAVDTLSRGSGQEDGNVQNAQHASLIPRCRAIGREPLPIPVLWGSKAAWQAQTSPRGAKPVPGRVPLLGFHLKAKARREQWASCRCWRRNWNQRSQGCGTSRRRREFSRSTCWDLRFCWGD
jgi:hypothetical protein